MPVSCPEMSDSELMARFYHCDATAFDTLANRWRPRLGGFFRKLGFSSEEAEDLTQDTVVRLYLTKEKLTFDINQPLAPFLFTVARNLAIQQWRRRPSEDARVPLIEALDACPPPESLPREMVEDLFHCIWSLPKTQQLYVLLCGRHGLGDLSHNEIGQVLRKWPAQMTQISQRTRTSLRKCMEGKGYR